MSTKLSSPRAEGPKPDQPQPNPPPSANQMGEEKIMDAKNDKPRKFLLAAGVEWNEHRRTHPTWHPDSSGEERRGR
jgi:hypothetical protein